MRPVVFHWIMQRLTAIGLVPLSLRFIYVTLPHVGSNYEQACAFLKTFSGFMPTLLFATCAFYHGALGMEVIIEDYIPSPQRPWCLRILKAVAWTGVVAGDVALLKIFFQE